MLIYVRMNISYDQSLRGVAVSNLRSGLSPARGSSSSYIMEQSLLHKYQVYKNKNKKHRKQTDLNKNT